MFVTGRPMLGVSPTDSGSDIVAHTVVSVGPYAFTSRRPGAHFATSSPASASPADTNDTTDGRSPAPSTPNTAGGNVTCDTPRRATNSTRPAPGSNSPADATTTAAPAHNATNDSAVAASKPTDANCSTRLEPSTANRST
ncbi:hypothetical protein APS67_006758 [Streptomyces sp. AVP053U2]|nr:hypothetical protein APS67_006758 [Streptomyces sp. AVP053U2]